MPDSISCEPLLHVVLFEPEIPQNAGNVGRTCVAVGAKLWLVRPLGFRLDQRQLRRAGMDYWQHLDWEIVTDWGELQQRLAGRPMWLMTKRPPGVTPARVLRRVMCWSSAANRGGCRRRCCRPMPTVVCAFRCAAKRAV
jgi:tRNA G18 (ribose-2'-O)-methylase SpoU